MPEENKEQGESMEGILKSIKNIISGELDKTETTSAAGASAGDDEEVLELTNKVTPPAEKAQAAPPVMEAQASRDVLANIDEALGQNKKDEPAAAPAAAPVATPPIIEKAPEPVPVPAAKIDAPEVMAEAQKKTEDSLLSEQNARRAEESLKMLLKQVPKPHVDSPSLRSGQTLEDLVVESLKPMMSDWLNHNLPIIVQQIVEKEIRKILPKEGE